MKNLHFVLLGLFILVCLTSCGLSPCDCAHAEATNDTKTIKKCEEKMSTMSKEEAAKWVKKESECLETNWLGYNPDNHNSK